METSGNTSVWLRFSSDFLVSTKCKALFAVVSFRNTSAQVFVSLRDVLTLVSCPIVLSTYSCTAHCLKKFLQVSNFLVFSPLMLFWLLIILKLWLFVESAQKWILGSLWKESISDSRSVENTFTQKIDNWGSIRTDWWYRKGEAFCEGPFALRRQQPEKDKQNFDVASPWKNFRGRPWLHNDFDLILGS